MAARIDKWAVMGVKGHRAAEILSDVKRQWEDSADFLSDMGLLSWAHTELGKLTHTIQSANGDTDQTVCHRRNWSCLCGITCSASTWEVEARLRIQGYPQLHTQFKSSLGYFDTGLQNNTKQKDQKQYQ